MAGAHVGYEWDEIGMGSENLTGTQDGKHQLSIHQETLSARMEAEFPPGKLLNDMRAGSHHKTCCSNSKLNPAGFFVLRGLLSRASVKCSRLKASGNMRKI
jgi:hypothetical protein